jgi:hypothetical protein
MSMPTKKTSKRRTTKQPRRITGLEASLLSFRARNGTTPAKFGNLGEHISEHVRKIVFARKKSKAGSKTLSEIREVAEANKRSIANFSKKSRSTSSSPTARYL